MNILAVIMARGGSVGLPGKALKPLLGRPVLTYTFDHVRESKKISRTIVSSDDPAILQLAAHENFQTIQRPAHLASNTAKTDDVLRHAIARLQHEEKYSPDAVLMLYGNVPLRQNQMIDRAIDLLQISGADSVQSIAPVGKMHPYWMFDRDDRGRIKKHIPNHIFRRQDLPPLFCPTGALYIMKTTVLMNSANDPDPHAFLGTDRAGLLVSPEDSVDIDSPKDLFLAEAMLRYLHSTPETK